METQLVVALIGFCGVVLAGNGLITTLINNHSKKSGCMADMQKDMKAIKCQTNLIAEATTLSLESHKVVFKALREGQINGESEDQDRKINAFLHKCSSDSMKVE